MERGFALSSLPTCECTLVNNHWVLDGDPLTLFRAKNCIIRSKKGTDGRVWIPATPECSRDLMWFRQRYPLDVRPEARMRSLTYEQMNNERIARRILASDYQPKPVEFAPGEAARPHQLTAAELWKAGSGLLLADGLGVGKTASVIAALTDSAVRPMAIVLPPALEIQWVTSIKRFLPALTTHCVKSSDPYDLRLLWRCPGCAQVRDYAYSQRCPKCRYRLPSNPEERAIPDVVLCSYNRLRGWPDMLGEVCKTVVWEEGHALRRQDSDKWRAANVLANKVQNRIALSATPIFNYGGELWNVMECVSPGWLGPKDEFRANWCGFGSGEKEPPLLDAEAMRNYLVSNGKMLRRTAKDVGVRVGECTRIIQPVQSSTDAFRKATDRAGELARILLSEERLARGKAMQARGEFDTMMRQATGVAKAPWVAAFVEMIAEQEIPVVVFAWSRAVYDILNSHLAKFNPVMYTGTESKIQKNASLEKFVKGESMVFLMSMASGEGLDGLQKRCLHNSSRRIALDACGRGAEHWKTSPRWTDGTGDVVLLR